jgi:hypothetical protein
LLFATGVEAATVQRLLGCSSISATTGTYGDVIEQVQRTAVVDMCCHAMNLSTMPSLSMQTRNCAVGRHHDCVVVAMPSTHWSRSPRLVSGVAAAMITG